MKLLAGLDLPTGRVTVSISGHHASAEFIALLGKRDRPAPRRPRLRIRPLPDNHSPHISKETPNWLNLYPQRFEFVFTPKHGSWLNIVEIRVASKQELIDRIHLYFVETNADPVIFRWTYKMHEIGIG